MKSAEAPTTSCAAGPVRRMPTSYLERLPLHSAIGYVAPVGQVKGRAVTIVTERDRKLEVEATRELRAARREEARLAS